MSVSFKKKVIVALSFSFLRFHCNLYCFGFCFKVLFGLGVWASRISEIKFCPIHKENITIYVTNCKLTCCFLNQCFPCNRKLIHVFTIFTERNENFCYLIWYIKMCLKFCSSVCLFSLPKLPQKKISDSDSQCQIR